MATFLYKTKGDTDPKGKPRVYFTCHPQDFSPFFEKLCKDIFATHDCAVYYTPDMSEQIDEQDMATDLGQMNLFVVPVTFKLLREPSRAMDTDLAYAKQQNIPILPFMMESDIDAFYSAPDRFGERQYINPFSTDDTEISYADKLKKYLEAVLISDEMAERVRAAFDAYVFLSYRKKDRRYANKLMHLIHQNPEYRDIAIWYDEFLTPGESFAQNIEKALAHSQIFALLVTPNLLEEPGGKPNFVMAEEYPAAKRAGMHILPAEMVETDKEQLQAKYASIPDCVAAQDASALRASLLQALDRIAKTENNNDPRHNFLIGLAYLDGIDVEVNRERALALITQAAEADLPEAMKKLCRMYEEGAGAALDYRLAAHWADKLTEYCKQHHGEKHPKTLKAMFTLTSIYTKLGDFERAQKIASALYTLRCEVLGEEHTDTLAALHNLAWITGELGDLTLAKDLKKQVYNLRCRVLGPEHPFTLNSLKALAIAYDDLGNYRMAKRVAEDSYALHCKVLGPEHPASLTALTNLALAYGNLGDYEKEADLEEMAAKAQAEAQGEDHPDTLVTLGNLAATYGELEEYDKELELEQRVYALRCRVLGENHPSTLTTLNNLALTYRMLDRSQEALQASEQACSLLCDSLGERHPLSLTAMNSLASIYGDLERAQEAASLRQRVYELRRQTLGDKHPNTVNTLSNLAMDYADLGDLTKARELAEQSLALRREVLGEGHPDTLLSLENLAALCQDTGDYARRAELLEQQYELICKRYGEEHPEALTLLNNLGVTYNDVGDYARAVPLLEKAFLLRQRVLGEEHPDTQLTKSNLQTVQSNAAAKSPKKKRFFDKLKSMFSE